MFMAAYDCGPDVSARRKLIHNEIAPLSNALFIDVDCLMHQTQLAVRSGLLRAGVWIKRLGDSWKYFAMLANVTNVWRGHCKHVILSWLKLFGPIAAMNHGKKQIVKCIAGRWGSVHHVQRRHLAAGEHQIAPVLTDALQRRTHEHPRALTDTEDRDDDAVIDGVRIHTGGPTSEDAVVKVDQLQTYSIKMGRWSREATAGVRSCLLWVIMEVMHIAQGPLHHMLTFMEKHIPEDDVATHGDRFAQLVCGRGEAIWREYGLYMQGTDWSKLLDMAPVSHSQAWTCLKPDCSSSQGMASTHAFDKVAPVSERV